MLGQYLAFKREHADCIIFFQVGDFYEVFFEDALQVSQKLNLTLTTRDKSNPNPVPMCGVPVAAVDGYLDRLVALGFSVAVVSQENSASNTRLPLDFKEAAGLNKVAIRRRLSRIVTPGIRILSPSESGDFGRPICSMIIESEDNGALAFSHVQTGRIWVAEGLSSVNAFSELAKIGPAEVIVPAAIGDQIVDHRTGWVRKIDRLLGAAVVKFRSGSLAGRNLPSGSGTPRNIASVAGYSALGVLGKKAVCALVDYMDETTVGTRLRVGEISRYDEEAVLSIDSTTRSNLELVENSKDGSAQGSLLGVLNHCATLAGERLLRQWILRPLKDVAAIKERQDFVGAFVECPGGRAQMRDALKGLNDLGRIAARLELNIATPRELAAVRDALEKVPLLQGVLGPMLQGRDAGAAGSGLPLVAKFSENLHFPPAFEGLLERALTESPPYSVSDGGVIKQGYDEELDRLRTVRKKGRAWMAELEQAERSRSGISSLKIKFNYVLGFFIEVTRASAGRVPDNYIRRQSTANAERFTTDQLKQHEAEILGAEEREIQLEKRLFEEVRQEAARYVSDLCRVGEALAGLDALLSLAECAQRENYIRPVLDDSVDLVIDEGKHPVLAKLLEGNFVPNSLGLLSNGVRCFIITGPNMGGKSTYLRQAGLIVIMAQIGSFVPARSARIGVVDKIFARIGASDSLTEGESTFMVEMREASHIVRGATERSLVLIDEIGRGTATTDGLAIAQAILEWIVVKAECRTLFATHFHELTGVAQNSPRVGNLSVGSVEQGDEVVFTHQICEGPASKSYGLEVAKLAGLPPALLQRAQTIMSELAEQEEGIAQKARLKASPQLSLFSSAAGSPVGRVEVPSQTAGEYSVLKRLKEKVATFDVSSNTPLQALNFVSDLKDVLQRKE